MKTRSAALFGAAALALAIPAVAQAQESSTAPASQDWIAKSNEYTQQLMLAEAQFAPENASSNGLEQFDGKAIDLGPDLSQRYIAMEQAQRARFAAALASESDPLVKQDLQILIDSIDQSVEGTQLTDRLQLTWIDVPQFIFGSMNSALDAQIGAKRQAKALELLQRYAGLYPGSTPLTELAKARWAESLGDGKVGPYKGRVEDTLGKTETYIAGIHALFAKANIKGSDKALATLDRQLREYAEWEKANVLPKARDDFRLPPELYAFRLKQFGIDIPPEELIERARRGFYDTRTQMMALAPQVAAKFGFEKTDYPSVIAALKKDVIPNDEMETFYAGVLGQIDKMITDEKIIDVPDFPVLMRLGTPAENASQPAPHMQPPRLIGNTGERGQFVLGTGDPSAGPDAAYDDFNFKAASWTLSAHEARPGHELQFAQMVLRGVSQARALYAFNSVNAEGWGLYAEAEFMPYEPIEGQLIALQFLLLRESRAILDPMLNLGMITPAEATKWLREEVGLSVAMTKQEVDRYTFRGQGQAGSYFYGYGKLANLRIETEVALSDKFDRTAFNDFVISQGLLPLGQLADTVRSDFIPAQLAK
ncbi:DUF885 family protein [Altererythrobacter salegens]|uniref:DUF885 family protein n=1 Tax=Croceibacterium salegens TaxID=1737568 RepID=A0A6I4SWA8_9SPHN|nr:DUF885 domain-containing protein [Croceibacterium salegens]MXO59327.1 DUF885 family protein [Croceibacterium salegens]